MNVWWWSLVDFVVIVGGWEAVGWLIRRFRGVRRIEVPREKKD